MKITRRMAWLMVFLFCVVVWGLVAALGAYASEGGEFEPKKQPSEAESPVDVQKIKELDLSENQKKFIYSLIQSPEIKTGINKKN